MILREDSLGTNFTEKVRESLTIKNMWMSEFTRQERFYYNQSSVLVSDCQYLSSSSETKQVQGYVHEGHVYYE